MIERVQLPKGDLDKTLCQNTTICSYESEVVRGLYYGIKNSKFAVMRDGDAITCKVDEMPELAKLATKEKVRAEILDIYEDAIYFGLNKTERVFKI